VVLLLWLRSPAAFWLIFVPLSLATVLNIVPIGAVFAERFLYLPSAGACAAAGLGLTALASWEQRSRMTQHFLWIPLVAVLVFGSLTWLRNPVFHDAVALWEDAVDKAPEYPYPHYNLGKSYYDSPEFRDYQSPDRPGALHELQLSLELNPRHAKAPLAHYYLGKFFYERLGNFVFGTTQGRDNGTGGKNGTAPENGSRTLSLDPALFEALNAAATHFRHSVRGVDPEMLRLEPVLFGGLNALVRISLATNGLIVSYEESRQYIDDAERGGYESRFVIPLRRELENAVERKRLEESDESSE